jgi:predicted DNA-binding protein (MmcQ/YjbR family)
MNLDTVRSFFCLSFPGATEKLQWSDSLCFKVRGKIFAILAVDSVPPKLCFKCTPEKFAELVEQEEIIPAPYLARYKWVLLQRLDVLRGIDLEDLIRESHEMVLAKAPKKRAGLTKKKLKKKR